MTSRRWLIDGDPLAAILLARQYGEAESFRICERVAQRTADGQDEVSAIEAELGFVPCQIRDAMERAK